MSTEPDWGLYRTFAAVLREGSLSGAARALGIAQPSVARHVDALEAALGTKLFVRTPRGLSPTDRALALRPYAEQIETLAAAMRRVGERTDRVEGTVRVTASEIVAVERLPPVLAALRREHPLLTVELVASAAVEDLLGRAADVAVRHTPPAQQALVARRVGAMTLGFYAHRDYLARRGTPATAAELTDHDVIGFDRRTAEMRAVLDRVPSLDPDRFSCRTDSVAVQLAVLRAGGGIGVAPAGWDAERPELVRVLPDVLDLVVPTWVVMHEDLRSSAACRAVFELVSAHLTEPRNRSRDRRSDT